MCEGSIALQHVFNKFSSPIPESHPYTGIRLKTGNEFGGSQKKCYRRTKHHIFRRKKRLSGGPGSSLLRVSVRRGRPGREDGDDGGEAPPLPREPDRGVLGPGPPADLSGPEAKSRYPNEGEGREDTWTTRQGGRGGGRQRHGARGILHLASIHRTEAHGCVEWSAALVVRSGVRGGVRKNEWKLQVSLHRPL